MMNEAQGTSPVHKSDRGKETVGRFVIGKTIGKGTFGKVKLGIDTITGEKVAIKVLEKCKVSGLADELRVARELQILKHVRHPHIIQLYEIIDTKDGIYLIMEYASKGELFDYIVEKGKLKETEACRFYTQLLSGMEYLHGVGVAHRDLKPENLLLDAELNIKIVDFGLSNTFSAGQLLKTACGSPCYAPPEMVAGRPYNGAKADIWSSGVILFAMVCGFLPFEDANTSELYRKIMAGAYTLPNYLSTDLKDLIRKVLNTTPEMRVSVRDIAQHAWTQIAPQSPEPDLPLDELVLSQILDLGYSRESTIEAVHLNKHTQISTTYYLLKLKNLNSALKKKPSITNVTGRSLEKSKIDLELTVNYKKYINSVVAKNAGGTGGSSSKEAGMKWQEIAERSVTPTDAYSPYNASGRSVSPNLPNNPKSFRASRYHKSKPQPEETKTKIMPRPPSAEKTAGNFKGYRSRLYAREKSPVTPQPSQGSPLAFSLNRPHVSKDLENLITSLRKKRSLSRRTMRSVTPI